jgi:peptidoglycan/xylan/chitin deacetylase (PgdA/CDA1 family)
MVGFSVGSVANPSPVEKLLSLLSRINPQSFSDDYERLSIDSLLDGSNGNSLDSLKNSQLLFLTFDDGPQPCTSKILDVLASTKHRATFFVIGRNLTNPPLRDIAIKALQQGHEIGNHSYDHPDFATISAKRAEREIIATHGLLLDLYADAGMDPSSQKLFFRFPYGIPGSSSNFKTCKKTLAELNYCIANWDLDTNDWQIEFAGFRFGKSRLANVIGRAKTQDVVLLHDRNQTALLLPTILNTLDYKTLFSVPLSWYPTEKILQA